MPPGLGFSLCQLCYPSAPPSTNAFKAAAIIACLKFTEHLISKKKTNVFLNIPSKGSIVCLWLTSVHLI